jgi:hypothetical protein
MKVEMLVLRAIFLMIFNLFTVVDVVLNIWDNVPMDL